MMWRYKKLASFEEAQWMKRFDAAETSHVFFHPAVMNVWLKSYEPLRQNELIIVEATCTDGNKALMPLVLWKKGMKHAFMRCIVPVGYSDYDYHDPLFSKRPSAESLQCFWSGLLDFLKPFKADELSIEGIRTSMIDQPELWIEGEICPNLNLQNIHSEEELMNFFSTKLRGDIRRQIRRLNEMGRLWLWEFKKADEVPDELWNRFMEAHTKKWPNAYKAPGFHHHLLEICSADGPVHFSALMLDETPIAWHLGFEWNGVYYYYMPAGNSDYQKQSPVKIHLYFLLCRAIEKGYQLYDHLRGDETYKSGWSDGFTHVNSLVVHSSSVTATIKREVEKAGRCLIKLFPPQQPDKR